MSQTFKRVLAVILVIFTVFAWYVTIFGIGSAVDPIKDKINLGLDIKGGVYVVMEADTDLQGEELTELMDQTKAVMENRVYEMGFSEAVVTIEGTKRLRIEIPGAEDAEEAIDQIGQVAQLKFLLADGTEVVTGDNLKDAQPGTSQNATGYVINVRFDTKGADLFAEGTKKAYTHQVTSTMEGVDDTAIAIVLDDNIICAPVVNEVISGGSCEISGNYDREGATALAALIRGGSLPVTLKEVTSSTQSASIGYNALQKSVYAGIIGFALVFVLMILAYGVLGVVADVALLLYVIMILWAMAFSGGTLTLPGIAGIILGVGMAVDANVIIFSRMREELADGRTVRSSFKNGFHSALSAILDAQITTLIAGVVLYEIGSATVKGFSVTLMLGIIASIITGVVISRLYIDVIVNLKAEEPKKTLFGVKEDGTVRASIKTFIHFIKNKKVYYIISVAIIVIGLVIGGIRGYNFGIDFTGGTMMQIEMGQQVDLDEAAQIAEDYGCESVNLVYGGSDNDSIILRTTTFLENADREKLFEVYQDKYGCSDDALVASEQFGPAVGDELKANAIKAIILAALCMLIYIVVRFRRMAFGLAAVTGLVHDVLITLAFYGIFHITINNPFIAGILTIVGYSINDTIVIFDRIRENINLTKKKELSLLCDESINQTLGRSIMTSLTTLLVMIPLFLMVSTTIRQFILPLMVGVIVGSYSSIFVCSPVFHDITKALEKRKFDNTGSNGTTYKKKNNYKGAPKKDKPKDYGNGAVV